MFLVHHFKSATLSHLITKTLALTMSDFSTPVDDSKRYPQIMHKHSISWSFFRIRRRLYLPLYPLVQGAVDVVFLIFTVCHYQIGITFVLKCCHVMCPLCWNLLVLDELRSRGLVHN